MVCLLSGNAVVAAATSLPVLATNSFEALAYVNQVADGCCTNSGRPRVWMSADLTRNEDLHASSV